MRKGFFLLTLLLATLTSAQERIYGKSDSIFVTSLLTKYSATASIGEQLLSIAKEFTGHKYVAGTLDTHSNEPLVISTTAVDCTTFVEYVLAIHITINEGKNNFDDFCRSLETIRYRNGIRNGYASRLHYISQWAADSAKKEFLEEVTQASPHHKCILKLNYMSCHPASYRQLRESPQLVNEIARWEEPFRTKEIAYIPKDFLRKEKGDLQINDGDIIALTTNIEGLDVVHIGFAFWEKEELRILHASSAEGKVMKENRSLHLYQKEKKSHTGIRVFRVKK